MWIEVKEIEDYIPTEVRKHYVDGMNMAVPESEIKELRSQSLIREEDISSIKKRHTGEIEVHFYEGTYITIEDTIEEMLIKLNGADEDDLNL